MLARCVLKEHPAGEIEKIKRDGTEEITKAYRQSSSGSAAAKR
jgi:hypothetical protein